ETGIVIVAAVTGDPSAIDFPIAIPYIGDEVTLPEAVTRRPHASSWHPVGHRTASRPESMSKMGPVAPLTAVETKYRICSLSVYAMLLTGGEGAATLAAPLAVRLVPLFREPARGTGPARVTEAGRRVVGAVVAPEARAFERVPEDLRRTELG